ncbi:MAG: YdeI/OmpD-associated family protein [Thaumarchaeota archaeon]|nr:YdeI/OmpD-associated family protein [Nitrososphaerota archaeon]
MRLSVISGVDEIVEFKSAAEWEEWLTENHSSSKGVWIRLFKKGSGVASVTNPEALDAALCYGWITGQIRPYDGTSWLGRFVPRRPKSIWSKINVSHVERLTKEGRMKPAGLKQVDEAKRDGRWARAYSPPSKAEVPADFTAALKKNKAALAFFRTLNRANVYAVVFRLENAKSEQARKAKIDQMVKMFERGERFH